MSSGEGTSRPPDTQQNESRRRPLTEKGQGLRDQNAKKHGGAFYKAYDCWKQSVRESRTALKAYCCPDELDKIEEQTRTRHDLVRLQYEPIMRNQTTTPDIASKMDTCANLTEEIVSLVSKRKQTIDGDYNIRVEKEKVRIILDKEAHGSVFGHTATKTVPSEKSQKSNYSSTHSSSSSKRQEAEAELAAKLEQAKAMKDIQVQQSRLNRLENELQLEEATMVAEMERIKAEKRLKLEEERVKLEQLRAEKEVQVAAARARAYETPEIDCEQEVNHRGNTGHQQREPTARLSPNAPPFHPWSIPLRTTAPEDTLSLAQALASSLSISRLPAPEPTIFNGDPMKYIDWKTSFMSLIDQKPLPASEKMFYLKTYLTGEARKALQGFFYRNSEEAYIGAWKMLEDRYGNPFILQRAYREKLTAWPKIGSTDALGLREFADFLQGCTEAIPHVKGLTILNDCEENHKLLKKLPEWIVRRWSRIVVEELDKSGNYPDFISFTTFLNKEARIACNPVASPFLINSKTTDDALLKKARAFNTSTQPENFTRDTEETINHKARLPCPVCKDETHSIARCPTFASRSMEHKRAFIHENRLCFGCLRQGHVSKDCKRRHTCNTCRRQHPSCLHEERRQRPDKTNNGTAPADNCTNQGVQRVMSYASTQYIPATSSIVPVLVSSIHEPKKEILTYALLDTQSDSTFILEDLLEHLNVDPKPVKLKLSTMTAVDTVLTSTSVSGLQVRGLESGKRLQIKKAYTRDFIPVDKSYIPTQNTALLWPHLEHLADRMPALQDCQVGLLIGYNCPSALAPLEVVIGGDNEPFAQRTELGWSIIGSSNPHLDRQGSQSFVHRVAVKEMPAPPVTDVLRALESDFNERIYEDKYVSQDDIHFIQFLSGNIRQKGDGHLEMPLPFKSNNPPALPNNKRLATVRLQCLKRKLKGNKRYHDHYKAFMEEIIGNGDAELAPATTERDIVWYLPHHGVYHPKNPAKLRVVFDCSAKFRGSSLNDTLLTGPDLINSLVGVLCRFRKEAVAVICDIERMFHQFFVTPQSRDYLRFLWWEHGNLENEPQEYRMAVHLFGAASSPGCANFGLKYLARQHATDYPVASAFIEKNFYVDDGLASVASVEEAKSLIKEAQALCKVGGLRLHKFNSNRKEVLDCVDLSERATTIKPLELKIDATPAEHALGIQWSIDDDTFSFNIRLKDQPSTRRGALSIVASLYDPLGFIAPFALTGKCVLQELCRRGIGWDDSLPDDLRLRWEEWKIGLQKLKEVAIPRGYRPQDFGNVIRTELHHFSDASSKGYGACSYLRCKTDEDSVHCSLVMAKARVAPTRVTSIPRLELSAAVVATKLSVVLKRELDMVIDEEFFWTDSQVVLGYIHNEARRFHVFVANRVQLIRENTDPNQWHYVDTAENPADHASRGLQATQIASSSWITGPKFLWQSEVNPKPNPSTELLVGDPEVKAVLTFATKACDCTDILNHLKRLSSWTKLLKVVARIKRLGSKQEQYGEVVTIKERERATQVIIKLVQQQAFTQELETLQEGKRLASSSSLFPLDPILHEGILRVGGRLKQSSLSQELKHPIILPKDSHITKLILADCHIKICHQGRNQTQMEIRANGFWVIGGSRLVAKLIHNCVQCRKLRRPTEEQRMAELPRERIEISPPFTYSGMDCFGPFLIKKARTEHKRYGLIFTCLSSRAVHIEMLEDLSTDAFINALRCFTSIRGAVRQLRCDQGTNFVGASNELRGALKQCDTKSLEAFLADKHCEFVFNAPSASHAGGVWERQIRTIRNVLNATLAQCPGRLDDASLRTLFYEAMSVVNSRPLTVDGINDPKALEPLTPNHLLTMKSRVAPPPPGKFVKEDMYARKRWRRVQYLIEQFWSRWKEYLMNISIRQKWHTPRRNLKVNDIVIVSDDNLPRNQWLLARVVQAIQESDGLVRRVKIQIGERKTIKDHSSNRSVIERPIQKLVLLVESD